MSPRRARTIDDAAAFVDGVGLALLFPAADLVLPSLWEAVAGGRPVRWALRDADGKFLSFTPEFDRIWRWKDELPERRLACAGKHLGRAVVLVAPRLVGALYALSGRPGVADDFRALDDLSPLEREVAEVVLETGPCSGPEIRRLLGTGEKRAVEKAVEALQRRLVLTNAGADDQEAGWAAVSVDVFARRWRARLRRLPEPEKARRELARRVLEAAGEVSAADLAAALRWRRTEAAAVLDDLANRRAAVPREEDGYRIWTCPGV